MLPIVVQKTRSSGVAGTRVQAWVQPLCMLHRPACFRRLAAFGAAMPRDTQGARLMGAINRLSSPAARMLAKVGLQGRAPAPADLVVQVPPMNRPSVSSEPLQEISLAFYSLPNVVRQVSSVKWRLSCRLLLSRSVGRSCTNSLVCRSAVR